MHFQIDNVAGRLVGETMAGYIMQRAGGTGWQPRKFVGAKTLDSKGNPLKELLGDFDRHEPMDREDMNRQKKTALRPYFEHIAPVLLTSVEPTFMKHAWDRAYAEWADWRIT